MACAAQSEVVGLRRYGHHSALIKPNVILTTGGFGEENGHHCRMRSFHVLMKYAGSWQTRCVKKENPDKGWGECFNWDTDGRGKGDVCAGSEMSVSDATVRLHWQSERCEGSECHKKKNSVTCDIFCLSR